MKSMVVDLPVSYRMDYKQKGSAHVKTAMLREMVPVEIKVSDRLESAFHKMEGRDGGSNFVYEADGLLFKDLPVFGDNQRRRTNLDDFQRYARSDETFRGTSIPCFSDDAFNTRKADRLVTSLPQFEDLNVKEVLSRDRSRVGAQIARYQDWLLVDGTNVYSRADRMPAVTYPSYKHSEVFGLAEVLKPMQSFVNALPYSSHDEFVESGERILTLLKKLGNPVCGIAELSARVLREKMSWVSPKDAHATYDAFAHWVVGTGAIVGRLTFVNSEYSVLDGSSEFIDALLEVKRLIPREKYIMGNQSARVAAGKMIEGLSKVSATLVDDQRAPFVKLARDINVRLEIIAEVRPDLIYAERAALEDDLETALRL